MNIVPIDSARHPLLPPFANIMRRDQATDSGRSNHLLAEGRILITTLARAGVAFESILISQEQQSFMTASDTGVKAKQWLVAPTSVIHEVCGFHFHGGMLGLAPRPQFPPLEEIAGTSSPSGMGIVLCSDINQQDNIGVIIRTAKAFGMAAVVATEDAGDLLSRRILRQSMGAAALMPVLGSQNLRADIIKLQQLGFEIIGAALTDKAQTFQSGTLPKKFALLLGNEALGLSREILDLCTRIVKIDMVPGHDSLNVATAAGILLQHFSQAYRI